MNRKYFLILCAILFPLSIKGQNNLAPVNTGLTFNESGENIFYRGWPLLVSAVFFNENSNQDYITVKLISGWENAFHFKVVNSDGDEAAWQFHLAVSPGEDITLDSLTYAELGFWLEPQETNQIPAGEYKLTGILDSTAYPELGSNFFSAITDTYKISFTEEPASLSIEQRTKKDILSANLNILKGDDNKALEYLNGILGYNPDNLSAVYLTGILLEDQGDFGSALYAYSKAADIFLSKNPDSPEPPVELMKAQNELAYKLDNSQAFNITLADKDTSHPFYGLGSSSCFYADNIPIRELQLKRGNTYKFYMKNIPAGNPFYISRSIKGGGPEPYNDGVTGAPADSNEIITFSVSLDAPDTLFYQSFTNEYAGWRINITDSSGITSVNENPNIPQGYYISLAYPNPFNPQTNIRIIVNKPQHILIKVFDITGEELLTLYDGNIPADEMKNIEFNGSNSASGIYLIRVEGSNFTETRKVIMLK